MGDKDYAVFTLLDNVTTTVTGSDKAVASTSKTIQAKGSTTSGTGLASIAIEATNDAMWPYLTVATISLTLGTIEVSDGIVINGDWQRIRARVVSISGTGASVSVMVGV